MANGADHGRVVILRNAWLMHLAGGRFERADVRIEGTRIAAVAPRIESAPGAGAMDLGGLILMPGLTVGHHHLYSALASTMPAPPRTPRNFHEILQLIWWRLDRALDRETTELSGLAGAFEAALCGVTTIIDHHASPGFIAGSLDALRGGIAAVGQRAVLCYEVTGRNGGAAEQDAGLAENERFVAANRGPRFAGMVGAHAAFTVDDAGLRACAELSRRTGAPVHIHVAEDPCDDAICRAQFGAPLLERLERTGILAPGNLLGHCTHVAPADIGRAKQAGCLFAHNTRSNMNNAVGYAPIGDMVDRAVLGTDGIGSDLFEEFRAAVFRSNEAKTGAGWDALLGMIVRASDVAGERLGVKLGRIEADYEADLVVIEPPPAMVPGLGVPAGHMLFCLSSRHVRDVMRAGEWIVRGREVLGVKRADLDARLREAVPGLWARLPAQ
ncbi:amidohydrolase family protein [Candidatus Poribacteria bacterium]|nr:amidohydrolase family protein [Candidatus Poribacteria bacterium]